MKKTPSATRRLFLFAAYFPDGAVPSSLLFHVDALSQTGDVVLVADNDASPEEMSRFDSITLHHEAKRHGMYDFGSYKIAFRWAVDNGLTDRYDIVYFVNDSVFGPLAPIGPVLRRMESLDLEATAMVYNNRKVDPHMQSWFIGFRKTVFASDWFSEFLEGIEQLDDKIEVCIRYETGMTKLMEAHGVRYGSLFKIKGKRIYSDPVGNFRLGLPYIKKTTVVHHGGTRGMQVKKVFDMLDKDVRAAIIPDIDPNLLTDNPFTIAGRLLKHLRRKLLAK